MDYRINLYLDDDVLELCFGDVFFDIIGGLNADGELEALTAWDHPYSEYAAYAQIHAGDVDYEEPSSYGFVDLLDFWVLPDLFSIEEELLARVELAASEVTTHNAVQYSRVVYDLLHKMLLDSRDKHQEESSKMQEDWFNMLSALRALDEEEADSEEADDEE